MPATVTPIRPGIAITVAPPAAEQLCPVCTSALVEGEIGLYRCARCKVSMHGECFWGRVVTLVEWKDYLAERSTGLRVLCPAHRAPAGA